MLYLHLESFAQYVQRDLDRQITELDKEPAEVFEPQVAVAAQ